MQKAATFLIDSLKEIYNGNRFEFEMQVTVYVSGESKKELRREIILLATGKKQPLTKCSVLNVAEALKNKFDQPSLF